MMNEELIIPFIKVNQWMESWNKVKYSNEKSKEYRNKPNQYFIMFTIKADLLKKLANVYRRKANSNNTGDTGIQRMHDKSRSSEINRYIDVGFPLSEISKGKTINEEQNDLRMPGWLPTAIVANILSPKSKRNGKVIDPNDLLIIHDKHLELPHNVNDKNWKPKVYPIEIIDGQHRLWAFDFNDDKIKDYELPVVAFYDLDLTWQAYLFYTINIKPKKINRSLAYDLYPLLRVQEWLEKSPETAFVYKETRAQEIVEVLWSYPESPWKDRINMLGDTNNRSNISQAAFIRSLIATFFKTTITNGLGGLFGTNLNDKFNIPLNWNRAQQATFIIYIWKLIYDKLKVCQVDWAQSLRNNENKQLKIVNEDSVFLEPAFSSKYSLISTDQGVRGFLHIMNDMLYVYAEHKNIRQLNINSSKKELYELNENYIENNEVNLFLKLFQTSSINTFLADICSELCYFDWRTSSEPSLTRIQSQKQMVFKGSSGYKELRRQLVELLTQSNNKMVQEVAIIVRRYLKYD